MDALVSGTIVGERLAVSGKVKWYSTFEQFGFLVPHDGSSDVLLHAKCLEKCGVQTVREGTIIVCEVATTEKGRKATKILSINGSDVRQRRTSLMRAPELTECSGGFREATVKWYDDVRGFGFLTQGDGKPDIFFHKQMLRKCQIHFIRANLQVLVRYGQWGKGLRAIELKYAS